MKWGSCNHIYYSQTWYSVLSTICMCNNLNLIQKVTRRPVVVVYKVALKKQDYISCHGAILLPSPWAVSVTPETESQGDSSRFTTPYCLQSVIIWTRQFVLSHTAAESEYDVFSTGTEVRQQGILQLKQGKGNICLSVTLWTIELLFNLMNM